MVDVDCTHSMWDCSIMRADTNSPNEEASKDTFPAGLRVLVVDDDHSTLLILKRMLIACRYNVRVCGRATEALALLRENKNSFDLVISDVYMPDMDGFKLLEHVGLEMDLPVIMMSVDGDYNNVYKGITHGACDYLQKPVRIEELRNIWQHVYRKKAKELDNGTPGNTEQKKATEEHEHTSSTSSRKRKQDKDEEEAGEHDSEDPSSLKKPRVVWTVELHQQFVNAVNQLNIEKAVPKRILELMDVPGLTRENVASHLQKYRLYLKRIQRQQQENAMNIPVGNPAGNHGPVLTHPPGGVPSQQSGLLPLAGYLPSFGGGYQMEPPQQPLPLTPRGLTGGFTGTFVNNNIVSPRQAYQQTILEDIPFGAPSSLTASSVPSNLTAPSNFNNFSTGNLTTSSNFNLAPSNLPAPLTANAVSLVAPLYNEEICCTSAPKALNSVGYGGLTGFNHNQVLSPPASFNRSINFKKVDDQRSTADSSFKPRVSDQVNESAVTAKLGLQIDQPPADDLLNYLLKQQQQQEGVGFDDLVFDGYAPNNLFVK